MFYRWEFNNTQNYAAALFSVIYSKADRKKSKLYPVVHMKHKQMKTTTTKVKDEYSVWKQEFFNETRINPMHFFRILFQVNICNEFKRKKTVNDKQQSNKEWVPLEFPQYLPI